MSHLLKTTKQRGVNHIYLNIQIIKALPKYILNIYIYIYTLLGCLSGCLIVCIQKTSKRLSQWVPNFLWDLPDITPGLWMTQILTICLHQDLIRIKFWKSTNKYFKIRELFLLLFYIVYKDEIFPVEIEDLRVAP